MAPATVIEVLRRFLPAFAQGEPRLSSAQRRAIWALTHCRTAAMGGHVHTCARCGQYEFAYHSCNHRSCPQCGKEATARWVRAELDKRVGAPYFMVTFTLPAQWRPLFGGPREREAYDLFFRAAAAALKETLACRRWLGAATSGFTMVLHTWNQRLHFHPHLHALVPGAGLDEQGRLVTVKSAGFLAPQPVLSKKFRDFFRREPGLLQTDPDWPSTDDSVWDMEWGVHLQAFGDGKRAVQYLGAYVCRTAIGDGRMVSVGETGVEFTWKDRSRGGASRIEKLSGAEFAKRYLRHVLPIGLRAVRRYGFCHPAARHKRESITLQTGGMLWLGANKPRPAAAPRVCPCCGGQMRPTIKLPRGWELFRARPPPKRKCA